MSEYYNCTICRNYPCSCGTDVRTNLSSFDVEKYETARELAQLVYEEFGKKRIDIYGELRTERFKNIELKSLCKELLEALKEWNLGSTDEERYYPDKELIKKAEEMLK